MTAIIKITDANYDPFIEMNSLVLLRYECIKVSK